MQEATAHGKHIRIAPRKVQLVIDLIRGKAVGEAIAILRHTPKIGIANHRKDTEFCDCECGT